MVSVMNEQKYKLCHEAEAYVIFNGDDKRTSVSVDIRHLFNHKEVAACIFPSYSLKMRRLQLICEFDGKLRTLENTHPKLFI